MVNSILKMNYVMRYLTEASKDINKCNQCLYFLPKPILSNHSPLFSKKPKNPLPSTLTSHPNAPFHLDRISCHTVQKSGSSSWW